MDNSLMVSLARIVPQQDASSGVDMEAFVAYGFRQEWLFPEVWCLEPLVDTAPEEPWTDEAEYDLQAEPNLRITLEAQPYENASSAMQAFHTAA